MNPGAARGGGQGSPRHDLAGYRVGNPTPMGRFWVYRVAQPGRPGCTGLCVWTPRPRCVRALGAPPPLPPPGMCTCGEIVDENPARLAAPLSTTTCRERKADSEKRVQPLAGTTRVLLGVEKSRLAKTTGTQKPGCSKLPGSRNPATQIFRVEPGISTRRPGLRLGLHPDALAFQMKAASRSYMRRRPRRCSRTGGGCASCCWLCLLLG